MHIGILQTGRSPDETRDKNGDYDAFFVRYLDKRGFTFKTYAVLDGELPDEPQAADGWLITGSRFGAYEDHNWIPPLEDFLRAVYAQGIPTVGICFGHQILAQALGGKVEKFKGGWSVGPQTYQSEVFGEQSIIAWHQDQVTQCPRDATVVGHSKFCKNAMLAYGDKALTLQPHPEFSSEFLSDLLDARGDILPPEIAKQARDNIAAALTSTDFADHIEAFFKAKR